MYDLSTTELVVWTLVIIVLAIASFVGYALLERPAKRNQVRQRRRPEGDLRDPRGRWDMAPKIDREHDDSRR